MGLTINKRSCFCRIFFFVHLILQNQIEMISVKVSYTVKPEFVEQNKRNIAAFLADFKKLTSLHFLYHVYLQADELTFLHISMYESETVQQQVLNVPSFLSFQQERGANHLTGDPQVEHLTAIGSSLSLIQA